jgi:hypothetical protein
MIVSNEVDVDHAMVRLKLEPENFKFVSDKLRWTKTRSKGNQSNLKKRNKVLKGFVHLDMQQTGLVVRIR